MESLNKRMIFYTFLPFIGILYGKHRKYSSAYKISSPIEIGLVALEFTVLYKQWFECYVFREII